MYKCKHCSGQIPSFEDIMRHACFMNKAVFMKEDENILYHQETDPTTSCQQRDDIDSARPAKSTQNDIEKSQKNVTGKECAIWTKKATIAAISLHEANIEMLDHPKKKGKIWEAVQDGLLQLGIKMSTEQVRWKINASVKKYKQVVDNNSRSGRANMEFEWFNQLHEIFAPQRSVIDTHTVSSKLPKSTSESRTSTVLGNEQQNESTFSDSTNPVTLSKSDTAVRKIKRPLHGTGSKIAATKVELEKQWLQHLEKKEERDKIKDKRHSDLSESKKEVVKLKRRQLDLKEAELEQRKEIAAKK